MSLLSTPVLVLISLLGCLASAGPVRAQAEEPTEPAPGTEDRSDEVLTIRRTREKLEPLGDPAGRAWRVLEHMREERGRKVRAIDADEPMADSYSQEDAAAVFAALDPETQTSIEELARDVTPGGARAWSEPLVALATRIGEQNPGTALGAIACHMARAACLVRPELAAAPLPDAEVLDMQLGNLRAKADGVEPGSADAAALDAEIEGLERQRAAHGTSPPAEPWREFARELAEILQGR